MLPKRYTCYPRPISISLGLHFTYLLGVLSYLLGIHVIPRPCTTRDIKYCNPRHIPKGLNVLSKTYDPISEPFFTIPLGVHFIPLVGVGWVQASWVTCHMSWVTCTYLLGIHLGVHLIPLGSQSCVHTSWVAWGFADVAVCCFAVHTFFPVFPVFCEWD